MRINVKINTRSSCVERERERCFIAERVLIVIPKVVKSFSFARGRTRDLLDPWNHVTSCVLCLFVFLDIFCGLLVEVLLRSSSSSFFRCDLVRDVPNKWYQSEVYGREDVCNQV